MFVFPPLCSVLLFDGEEEAAVVHDLPMGFIEFVAVGEEEGIIPAVEAVDLGPAEEGNGFVFPRDINADAASGGAEVEGGFFLTEAVGGAAGGDYGTIASVSGFVEEGAFPVAGLVEGVVGEETSVAA